MSFDDFGESFLGAPRLPEPRPSREPRPPGLPGPLVSSILSSTELSDQLGPKSGAPLGACSAGKPEPSDQPDAA